MLVPLFLAAVAALPAVQAQDVTASATRCTTRFGMFAAPTGASLSTWFNTATTVNSFAITSTTRDTITITPSATTFTDVVSITSTFFTTTTSTPVAVTIAAPADHFPLLAAGLAPTPAPIGRFKRSLIESRAAHLQKMKRQTAPGNTGGFMVSPDGSTTELNRIYPQLVVCRVSITINSTSTTIVTGLPQTETLVPATATAVSTSTVSTTETIIQVIAQPTIYAACQANNVVSNVPGFDRQQIYFDRIVFRPNEGFPVANSLVVNTTSAVNCCIACQNQPFCAGSFFAPSRQTCHLQLTQAAPAPAPPTLPAPSSNASLPMALSTGAPYPRPANASLALYPTAISGSPSIIVLPTAEPSAPGTCSIGSLSLYLGEIRGQNDFPPDVALSFSNGPCGRLSIDFEAVTPETNDVIVKRMVSV